eukprot:Amastigsp_a847868_24.p4 type:complete len:120 gc:universal Amastigsp_a847868_24:795-436(-)
MSVAASPVSLCEVPCSNGAVNAKLQNRSTGAPVTMAAARQTRAPRIAGASGTFGDAEAARITSPVAAATVAVDAANVPPYRESSCAQRPGQSAQRPATVAARKFPKSPSASVALKTYRT